MVEVVPGARASSPACCPLFRDQRSVDELPPRRVPRRYSLAREGETRVSSSRSEEVDARRASAGQTEAFLSAAPPSGVPPALFRGHGGEPPFPPAAARRGGLPPSGGRWIAAKQRDGRGPLHPEGQARRLRRNWRGGGASGRDAKREGSITSVPRSMAMRRRFVSVPPWAEKPPRPPPVASTRWQGTMRR